MSNLQIFLIIILVIVIIVSLFPKVFLRIAFFKKSASAISDYMKPTPVEENNDDNEKEYLPTKPNEILEGYNQELSAQKIEVATGHIDRERLKTYYQKTAKAHRRKARGKIIQCYITFAFQFVFCTGVCFLASDMGGIMVIFLLQETLDVWYIINFYFKIIEPLNSVSDAMPTSEDDFPEVWALAVDLRKRMSLEKYSLKMYYIRSSDVGCFVNVDRHQIHLFVSRGFVANMDIAPKDCESILAHEFGHVYQGDNKLFLVNKAVITIPAVIIIITGFISVLLSAIIFASGNGVPNFTGGINFIYVFTLISLTQKKTEAEYLADLASIVFVENSTIANVISKFSSPLPKKYSMKNLRLINLERTLSKFRLDV